MDNNSYEQLIIMQATIDSNRKDSDEKTKKLTEDLTVIIKSMMDQLKYQNPHQIRRIKQRLRIVDIIHKLVACGLSNTRSEKKKL